MEDKEIVTSIKPIRISLEELFENEEQLLLFNSSHISDQLDFLNGNENLKDIFEYVLREEFCKDIIDKLKDI